MAELKTRLNDGSVEDFLNTVEPESKRQDAFEILELMKKITGCPPKMWGDAIVGFDTYHYKYSSGREGDFFKTGFVIQFYWSTNVGFVGDVFINPITFFFYVK